MTPAQLATYLAVVDTGSARAAAVRLTVTESAVSASLAGLQRSVGVPLVVRHGRGLRVTEAGIEFAGYARRILGLMDEARGAARQVDDPEGGRLRLGAVATAGEYLVPGLLATFRQARPGIEVTLEIGPRDQVLTRLADHELDLVIAGRPLPGLGLRTGARRPNSLVVVAAPGDPDLGAATWLLREPGSGTRAATLALLEQLQLEPPTLSLGSPGAVVASAVLGLGVTVASADAVSAHLADGTLRVVPASGTPLDRPWHAVTAAAPSPAARRFLTHVRDPDAAGPLAFGQG